MRIPSQKVSPRLPGAGPIMLEIEGLSDVVLAANTASPEILYTLPGPYLITGVWLGDSEVATDAAVGKLRLRIQDSSRNELFVDGKGGIDSTGGLSLTGRSPRWQSFRRVIRAGQKWLFQLENRNAFDVRPLLYFRLEEE